MAAKKKSVRKTETHDRLSVRATYPTGGTFTFTIGRSGERLTWGGSNDKKTAEGEMAKFMAWMKHRGDEKNGERMERLRVLAESVNSIGELVAKLDG